MADEDENALHVHLTTPHGIQILASIATSEAHEDISLQAQALRILSDHAHELSVAAVWDKILAYVLLSPALKDGDADLHLVLWRCIAQCAETAVPLLPQLWTARRSILDAAMSIQDAPLHSTSLAAHSLAALVTSIVQHAPALLGAPCTTGPFAGLGDDSDQGLAFVHQVKLWYVLTNEAALFSMLGHVTSSITEIKVLFSAGMPSLVCREYVKYHETFDFHYNAEAFLSALVDVLWPPRPSAVAEAVPTSDRFSYLVLRLCLSKHKAVWSEMLRVLQHLADSPDFAKLLVAEPHLRGAIAHLTAKATPDDVAPWATPLLAQVHSYEHEHRTSVIQLPELSIDLSLKDAVAVATQLKTSGNRWFREGNYTAARAFYRLALSTLTVSESLHATRPPSNAPKMSVGQPVKVQEGNQWLVGMISDVNGTSVDVMFDNGSEADNVPAHRVHILPLETPHIADLRLHLCMNSAKCLHALGCTLDAIECLTYALTHAVPDHVPALYLRGVLGMATHNVPLAKADLQKAHQLVSKTKTHVAMVGDIRTAWSRLQLMVKHRKRADKRMIKEMVAYLNTINIE